jgi:type II secretory pathway pseudopilin PulG
VTLLAVAVVVFALSVLAAMVVPVLQRRAQATRVRAVAADLRTLVTALQAYSRSHGDWPDGPLAPGAAPAGATAAEVAIWRQPTALGGWYTWLPNCPQRGERFRAAIALTGTADNPVTTDRRQLAALDREIDDGNPDTGRLRLGYRDNPVFTLEH